MRHDVGEMCRRHALESVEDGAGGRPRCRGDLAVVVGLGVECRPYRTHVGEPVLDQGRRYVYQRLEDGRVQGDVSRGALV